MRPPPKPPRPRHPVSAPNVFGGDEPPTTPQGIEFQVALLGRYYREMAPEDRVTLMRNAEQWAARNRKP